MNGVIDVYKAGGILIKDGKFLVTRSKGKDIFYAPGGRIEQGEDPEVALIRELGEELSIRVKKENLKFFGTFIHPSAGENHLTIKMDVFLVEAWEGVVVPSHEIEEFFWITSRPPSDLKIGSIFGEEVLSRLKAKGLIE